MNKITLGFFLAKSKMTINGLLMLFALLLMNTQVSWGQGTLSIPIFSENFGTLANATPLTTTNSSFSFIRVGTSTTVNTIVNRIITQNPSSFTESSVLIGAKGGSISTIDKTGLTSFNSGVMTFKFKTPSSLTSALLLGAIGSGASFGSVNGFTGAQLSSAFQVSGSNLQMRAAGVWTTVQTVAVSTNYTVAIVFNNTAGSLNYGDSRTLASNKCHLWIDGAYVGEYSAATSNLTATAFRIYTTTSEFEVDDVAVYNSLPVPTTAIPDANFEQSLIDLGNDDVIDGKVLTSNISSVTELDVSGLGISNLTGIEAFSSLQDLYCADNALTSLNVSMLSNLRYLDLENNLLTSLNITGLNNLTQMVCWFNHLTSLDLSSTPNLVYLDCDDNAFEVLDVSKLTNLIDFYCSGNSLTSLDVRGLTSLRYFECLSNPLLSCILVDNVAAAEALESATDWAKDATATYAYCSCNSPITWNGTAWSNVTGPTSQTDAIINGTYSESVPITACSLTIKNGATVTIPSGTNITLNAPISVEAGGSFTLSNNANLVQTNKNSINSGAINVNRNSNPLKRLDYTIWSSPVANQNLLAFSPLTTVIASPPSSRFYNYDSATNFYSTITNPSATSFAKGAGYLIRMPNEDPSNLGGGSPYSLGTATITYNGLFTGVPNNGDIPVALNYVDALHGYNMVGNPYSSTIDANTFITANTANIESTLYFWRKTNGSGTAYATYNPLGGTLTYASTTSEVPNGKIQVGQGFFVQAKSAVTVPAFFTNAMREVSPTSTQFFKTKQVVKQDRVWLNLTNATGVFSQALVGYVDGASQGIDIYDGKYINDSKVALTSNINNEEYTIQGRPAFDPSDVVVLNFKTNVAGDYTIAIDHADGLFANAQDIYLVDAANGSETDLKVGAYTFTAAAGVDNARFSLKYQRTLKVDVSTFTDNSVTVYKSKGTLYVNSGAVAIANIKVFDIQGRLIAEQKNVKANSATISNLKATQQVLIVKVTSQDNKVVSKKVVN